VECEVRHVTLREEYEYRLREFDSTVLRKDFDLQKMEVTGEWRKLNYKDLARFHEGY